MSGKRVTITVDLEHAGGPRRYDEDDALSVLEDEIEGTMIYPTSANGEDETQLAVTVVTVAWA